MQPLSQQVVSFQGHFVSIEGLDYRVQRYFTMIFEMFHNMQKEHEHVAELCRGRKIPAQRLVEVSSMLEFQMASILNNYGMMLRLGTREDNQEQMSAIDTLVRQSRIYVEHHYLGRRGAPSEEPHRGADAQKRFRNHDGSASPSLSSDSGVSTRSAEDAFGVEVDQDHPPRKRFCDLS